ncbi:hypothetical protein [Ferrimicrobium sp.]|uniref:NADH-quinone oxidoreductase subunit B family protein n=1 Tax=Ferrimicrobium sp. TaxID=2926050 RepID=UPI002611D934|nr:hypothetical protein [Ferrimicrobium sp.]
MLKQLLRTIIHAGRVSETEPPSEQTSEQPAFPSGSVHLRHLDVGSCNGCELEINACFSSIYDIEQYGISMAASPRHCDGVLITGVVTKNLVGPLHQTIAAVPAPKRLIAIGDCAINGGPFLASYAVEGSPADLVPIDLKVPGCPPDPAAIVAALRELSGR